MHLKSNLDWPLDSKHKNSSSEANSSVLKHIVSYVYNALLNWTVSLMLSLQNQTIFTS